MDSYIILFFILFTFFMTFCVYLSNKLDKAWKKGFNQGINAKAAERRLDRKLDTLLEGIGGVQSVNLSAKRYVELLKAEEELIELKLALKEIGGKDDAKV